MITRRCSERRFFMRPDRETNNAFIYCLALAAHKASISIVGVSQLVQMSPIQQGLENAPSGGAELMETATRWVPVASDATASHCSPDAAVPLVSSVQVIPEFADVQMLLALPCEDAATRWVPVASDATAAHCWPDAAVPFVRLVQVVPESVDTQMSPPDEPGWQTATRCVPVELDATPCQSWPQSGFDVDKYRR